MLIIIISLLVWAVLSSAVTYCQRSLAVPPFASCDRALTTIGNFVRAAGNDDQTFGPSESEAKITLPMSFGDPMPSGQRGHCTIMLLWRPRSRVPSPPPSPDNFDHFLAVEVLRAAARIRNTCVQVGKLGFEWIEPRQWVQVVFVTTFPRESYSSNATGIDGGLSNVTANGTNVTVSLSMVNEGNLIENVPDLGLTLTGIATVSGSTATEVVAA